MEEKKAIKISLSTFFLILSIIVICVMGYFLYLSNSKITSTLSDEKELNSKIAELENKISTSETSIKAEQNNVNSKSTSEENSNKVNNEESNAESNEKNTISNNTNTITFNSLSGKYIGNANVEPGTTPNGESEVRLSLFKNGSYIYNNKPGFDSGHVGYYTFDGKNLILHEIVICATDIGRTITSDSITLKINDDDSITDSNLNVVLKKSSNNIEEEYDVISTELKNALNNNSLNY